ncbi:hypothetical protein P7L75_09305 [Tistrella mobilis]|uniref:hypothetical protein n=1 Tax=Tistrella mobilis TaxID=171437 RepID=UPI003557C045
MTITYGTPLRAAILDAAAALFDGGSLSLFGGTRVGSPAAPAPANPIAIVKVPLQAYRPALEGEALIAGDWTGTALRSGDATWFRLADRSGALRIDGSVSGPGGGGDLILTTTAITTGEVVRVIACTLSGGVG